MSLTVAIDHFKVRVSTTETGKTYAFLREEGGKEKVAFSGTVAPDLASQLRALADSVEVK